jgi:hypothetical protein
MKGEGSELAWPVERIRPQRLFSKPLEFVPSINLISSNSI